MGIAPGDFVVCLEQATDGRVIVHKDRIYRVETLMGGPSKAHPCSAGEDCRAPGLTLVEPKVLEGYYWCSTYFRPVYRPQVDAFDYMLSPPPPLSAKLMTDEMKRDDEATNKPSSSPPEAAFYIDYRPSFSAAANLRYGGKG
jgi:hypothetical protein